MADPVLPVGRADVETRQSTRMNEMPEEQLILLSFANKAQGGWFWARPLSTAVPEGAKRLCTPIYGIISPPGVPEGAKRLRTP
ncbi:MAG: hypothetical protein ACREC6_05190, partial [Hyphomicrobiaceae bacterium]